MPELDRDKIITRYVNLLAEANHREVQYEVQAEDYVARVAELENELARLQGENQNFREAIETAGGAVLTQTTTVEEEKPNDWDELVAAQV